VSVSVPSSRGALPLRPHVVIVGAGFGGIYAARALRKAPVRVTVVDRKRAWTRSVLPAVVPVVLTIVAIVVAVILTIVAIVAPVVTAIVPSEGTEAGTYRDRQGADSGQEKRSSIHVRASW